MSDADSAKKNEKLKLALIPVLVLVLLGVLMTGDSGKSNSVPELAVPPGSSSAGSSEKKRTADDRPAVHWPRYELNEILHHNPLHLIDHRAMLVESFRSLGLLSETPMIVCSFDEFTGPDEEESRPESLWTPTIDTGDGNVGAESAADKTAAADTNDETSAAAIVDDSGSSDPNAATTSPPADPNAEMLRLRREEQQRAEEAVQLAAAAETAEIHRHLQQLRSIPVSMYMRTRQGPSAWLGDRLVREGDRVAERIRVRSIDRSGITFEVTGDRDSE
ncbi:MAG: hypothetical protein KDA89_23455 [Planctomycetaceae bacterium]|nr:hypothetical protein [Planctomycetaceae bacterium]